MKKIVHFIAFFVFAGASSFAQNILPNPGFEQYVTCPDHTNSGGAGTPVGCNSWTSANYSPDYFNLLGQITYLTKIKKADFNVYVGVENLLDYKQVNPIVASDQPYSPHFDASMVWGPIYGRMLYAGLRYKIK